MRRQVFDNCTFLLLSIAGLVLSSATTLHAEMVIQPDRAAPATTTPRHPTLPDFSMEQRAEIYRSAIAATKEGNKPAVALETAVDVGTILPEGSELYPLPENIQTQVAAGRKYKYAVWQKQVLLVDPTNKMVVDILRDYVLRDYPSR